MQIRAFVSTEWHCQPAHPLGRTVRSSRFAISYSSSSSSEDPGSSLSRGSPEALFFVRGAPGPRCCMKSAPPRFLLLLAIIVLSFKCLRLRSGTLALYLPESSGSVSESCSVANRARCVLLTSLTIKSHVSSDRPGRYWKLSSSFRVLWYSSRFVPACQKNKEPHPPHDYAGMPTRTFCKNKVKKHAIRLHIHQIFHCLALS